MKIGTKSLLFGYHQVFIHPLFVAWAWWKLYGFPWDPRLWVAFFVHDLGYWGKPNMDGTEGEHHPFVGAKIMGALFDYRDVFGNVSSKVLRSIYTRWCRIDLTIVGRLLDFIFGRCPQKQSWYCFTFYHSRFLCKRYDTKPSKLCYADKLAIVITPTWLQLFLMNLTGEIKEYMTGQDGRTDGSGKSQREWVEAMKEIVRAYLSEQMGTCMGCGLECRELHYMCEGELRGAQWCQECFFNTPCGRGEHGADCQTQVRAMSR